MSAGDLRSPTEQFRYLMSGTEDARIKYEWESGYYLALHPEGTTYIVLRQNDLWYCCGVGNAIRLDTKQIIRKINTDSR